MMLPSDPSELIAWLQSRLQEATFTVAADVKSNARRRAAVLIALVLHPQAVTVLLTRRADHLNHHAGQISFPGGAVEATDQSVIATALRETAEEVGIESSQIQPICVLGEYHTISGFCVTPVLATLQPGYRVQPDPNEVAEAFEMPLSVLLDPSRYQKRNVERSGVKGYAHFLEYDDRLVWGATAGMLLQLSSALGLSGIPVDLTG